MESDMTLTRRIGVILKEAREARKLSVSEVAHETNIIPKFIDALEREDYSVFPGETYALGFLRNYAEYLNLDTSNLLDLYRGHQIDQSQTPVKELTRPMHVTSLPVIDFLLSRRNLQMLGGGVLLIALGIALVYGGTHLFSYLRSGSTSSSGALACTDRHSFPVTLPGKGAPPRIEDFTRENSAAFVMDTLNLHLCLKEVIHQPGEKAIALLALDVGKDRTYEFRAVEEETVVLSSQIEALSDLKGDIRITPRVLGDVSGRIQLESGTVAGASGGIRVTLEFVDDSYLEWTDDGKSHRGVFIAKGESRTFEAVNRLEMKIGNGAGVKILREGEPPRIAGPRGQIVHLVYRMAPDPLDPGMSRVVENIEVVR